MSSFPHEALILVLIKSACPRFTKNTYPLICKELLSLPLQRAPILVSQRAPTLVSQRAPTLVSQRAPTLVLARISCPRSHRSESDENWSFPGLSWIKYIYMHFSEFWLLYGTTSIMLNDLFSGGHNCYLMTEEAAPLKILHCVIWRKKIFSCNFRFFGQSIEHPSKLTQNTSN